MQDVWWFVSTIAAPVAIPILGMQLGRFFPLDKAKYGKKTNFWSQFRDGQLGWLAVAWSIGAIYEIKHYTGRSDTLDAYEILAFAATVIGKIVAGGGAIEATDNKEPRKLFFWVSVAVALASAYAFYNAHVEIVGHEAIATRLNAFKACEVAIPGNDDDNVEYSSGNP